MTFIFSLRWVCTSGNPLDLLETDRLAAEVMEDILNKGDCTLPLFSIKTKEKFLCTLKFYQVCNFLPLYDIV